MRMSQNNLYSILSDIDPNKLIVSDDTVYTHQQLVEYSDKISNTLRQYPKQSKIAIDLANSFEFISSFFGILKAGMIGVLVNHKLQGKLKEPLFNDCVLVINSDNYNSILTEGQSSVVDVLPSDPAIILYTSGSSGKSKGVIIPHSHLWTIKERGKNKNLPYCVTLITTSMCHMNGLSNMEVSLLGKSTIVLQSVFDSKELARLIDKYQVNNISGVPSTIHMLLEHSDLKPVKHINIASSPLTESLYNKIKSVNSLVTVTNSYGSTEAGPGLFGKHPTLPTPPLSVGYPQKGIDYRIVNDILEIRSPSMSIGYTNYPNKFTSDGYYVTNDMFTVDSDGFYYFMDRSDDMFVSGGHNIYPSQLESVVEQHPLVESSIVIAVDDDIKGKKPYMFVVSTTTEKELKDYMLEVLPYSHLPRRIFILDKMPLNQVNKIDKNILKEKINELK